MDDEHFDERQNAMTQNNGNGTALATRQPQQPQQALVRAGSRGLVLSNIDDMWRFAGAVAKSKIAPRGLDTQEKILIALEYGAEMGLRPMQSMAVVMVVNGRPSLYGDGMLAVAQASGHLRDIVETLEGDTANPESLRAICTVHRTGRPTPSRCVFTWKDAKQAGLTGSDTYKKFPGRMLKARARAFALRDAFPDVLCGVMSTDEVEDLGEQPAFVDGATQAPTDLETLMVTDATPVEYDDDPLATDEERDPKAPTDEELRRDGLLI